MINYTDIGSGEPLILIHGLGGKREMFNSQLPLSNKYRLIIVELRGHGDSELVENLTVEQFAKDVIEVLDCLNIKKSHFCGVSLGGLVVQQILKSYRSRILSLILANTLFFIPYTIGNFSLVKSRKLLKMKNHDQQINELLKTSLYNYENEHNKKLINDSFLIRNDTYLECSKSAFGKDYSLYLMTTNLPVLIIGSFYDKVTPVINSYVMNNMVKKSKLVVFKDAGHLSNIEKAGDFNNEIEKHIGNIK